MPAAITITAVDYEHTASCQRRAKIHGDDACSCSARAMYVSRRLPVGRSDHGAYHRADAIHGIAAVNGMDPAQGYTAALLGARILRAQRRADRSEPEPTPGEECRYCGQPMAYTSGPRRCPAAEMDCR